MNEYVWRSIYNLTDLYEKGKSQKNGKQCGINSLKDRN